MWSLHICRWLSRLGLTVSPRGWRSQELGVVFPSTYLSRHVTCVLGTVRQASTCLISGTLPPPSLCLVLLIRNPKERTTSTWGSSIFLVFIIIFRRSAIPITSQWNGRWRPFWLSSWHLLGLNLMGKSYTRFLLNIAEDIYIYLSLSFSLPARRHSVRLSLDRSNIWHLIF